MQILGENLEVENGRIMTSWNGLRKLPTLIFGKTQKPFWIKVSKMVTRLITKEKNFCTYFAVLKAVPDTFKIGFKNKKQI